MVKQEKERQYTGWENEERQMGKKKWVRKTTKKGKKRKQKK